MVNDKPVKDTYDSPRSYCTKAIKDLGLSTYSIEETLKDVNQTLDKHEVIHNLIVVDDVWTVENKFLTPSMKIKRNTIEKKYQANYSTWYDQNTIVVL